jgi:nitroreductase
MELLTGIETRSSAVRLGDPPPSRADLTRIIEAGMRAPDHGKLAPWRVVVIEGAARETLGRAMADALIRIRPDATENEIERERAKAFRAPVIVALAAHVTKPHRIPESDQILAVAAAAQNMFLAAHALGYGAMWKTGAPAADAGVKQAIGFDPDDQVVAYLYLGTPVIMAPLRPLVTEGLVRWL